MKFRDLSAQYASLKTEIDTAILSAIEKGAFIFGAEVGELEHQLAEYSGTRYCISCANGTDALQLVLMAWGIGPGDAVFTADFTFFASAGTASIVGATPVPVDIDPRTFNMSPEALEARIQRVISEGVLTPKLIVPVDLFGLPANYPAIEAIANKYGLKVLEDGAQGFGGSIGARRACSFGDAATTSFFPSKPLGAYGDGGAIFTNDSELDALLRSLRAQGRSPQDKYDNRLIGINSRLDTLQAAILIPKLNAFREFELDAVQLAARTYDAALSGIVQTPFIPEGYQSSWAQYSILLQSERERDSLKAHLAELHIPSMIYYPRGLHQQTAYAGMNLNPRDYPNTNHVTARILSLPMHPYLKATDIDEVVAAIKYHNK